MWTAPYSLDLCPTMADLLDVPQYSKWDGVSFAKSILSGEPCGRDSLVLSQMAHVCQRSARFGRWLYMRTVHDGFHLFPREMLFDLSGDPYEQNDVAAQWPQICAQGARILLDWQEEAMLRSDSAVDPMWTVVKEGGPFHAPLSSLEGYLKRLESTGRREGAQMLRARYLEK